MQSRQQSEDVYMNENDDVTYRCEPTSPDTPSSNSKKLQITNLTQDNEELKEKIEREMRTSEKNHLDMIQAVTEIWHNSRIEIQATRCTGSACYSHRPQYNIAMDKIVQITNHSKQCQQYIKYRCQNSALLYNVSPLYGYWSSRDGEKMKYWGGASSKRPGYCACGETGTCDDKQTKCNCDKNGPPMTQDEGYLTDRSKLPVTEMRFGDIDDTNEFGWHTLGMLQCTGSEIGHPLKKSIMELIGFTLTHNTFEFNEEIFLQLQGTAMGTKFAPQYANLFMHHFEEDFMETQTLRPIFYTRYIDDIFMIWTHGEQSLKKFQDSINDFHPNIRLTMESSMTAVSFLDTLVNIEEGRIFTSLYRKPTDSGKILNYHSFHPVHCKKGIVYSKALRIHKICSKKEDKNEHLEVLKHELIKSGYDQQLIRNQIKRALNVPREKLLDCSRNHNEETQDRRVPLVTTYFPGAEKIRKILRKHQRILINDPKCNEVFPRRPILAIRQPRNLRNILVNSRLPRSRRENGVKNCGQPSCKTCAILNHSTVITKGPARHNIKGHFTCKSSNVVYLIRCRKGCTNAWYVGETSQPLHKRVNGHRHDISKGNKSKPVGDHFSSAGHSESDMTINVLVGNMEDATLRKATEQKYIDKFDTFRQGLNIDRGCMSHYTMNA